MPVVVSLTRSYAGTIFESGARKFTDLHPDYIEPVKIYAGTGFINGTLSSTSFKGYSDTQLQNALDNGWINETEYLQVLAYKPNIES